MEGVEPAEVVEMEEERELYVAAMEGDVEFVQEAQNDEVLLRKTRQKYNLIHIATRYEQLEFIKALLEKLPNNYNLISDQENSYKNTPLHVAAEVGNLEIMRELYEYSRRTVDDRGDEGDRRKQPWLLKNSNGNTAVHVALIHGNVVVARFLLDAAFELAFIDNDAGETPLHIAIKQHVNDSESESLMAKMGKPFSEGGSGLWVEESELEEDNMSSMIEFLVEKASSVASVPDAKGVTPLHRAASLVTPYNLEIIRLIIKHCPQSVEVFDAKGKSILHLLINKVPSFQEGKILLDLKPVNALKNHQDRQGNTPLHIAAKRMDVIMVQILLQNSAKMNINNCDGISATTLFQQQNVFLMLRQRKFTEEESEAASRGNITYLRERMSSLGIYFLQSKDSKGRNVLHKLLEIKSDQHIMLNEFVSFIKEALELYPSLVCEMDLNGNTPVHILVQNDQYTKVYVATEPMINRDTKYDRETLRDLSLSWELLKLCNEMIERGGIISNNGPKSPWLVQNADGNAPLHEALRANIHPSLVMKLMGYDNRSASLLNKRKETPLHLLAKSPADIVPFTRNEIEHMVEAHSDAMLLLDEEGLSPIIRAFVSGNITTAITLYDIYPEAAVTDPDGNTLGHLLLQHPSDYFKSRVIRNERLRNMLKLKDHDGNTPLHTAVQDSRIQVISMFLDTWNSECQHPKANRFKHGWLSELLEIPNKDGETPADLIADFPTLPLAIENNPDLMKYLLEKGLRSSWGIPRSQLKYYMNSMNVIAALQTTITFTAAFTVPGGLIQDIGTPTLIRRIEFQVFMILDVIAMCLSMMVLICLLWIVATNNRLQAVRIQDFAVSLLLASFIATLFTFMAGVYATISPVKLHIAITTLIMCFILIMLIPKTMVMGLIRLTKCFTAFFTETIKQVTRWKKNFLQVGLQRVNFGPKEVHTIS